MKKFFLLVILIFCATDIYAQEQKTYTVKQGETLYSISKTLNVSVSELQQWNELSNAGLSIGQELIYYISPAQNEDTEPDPAPEPPSDPLINVNAPVENTYYTIKSGDNLYNIARAHNMTVNELKELNNLTSDVLSIGQKIAVRKKSVAPVVSEFSEESAPQGTFALYTIEQGETLSSLLSKFKMTEQELQELNPEINVAGIGRGQQITVLLPPSRNFDNPYLNKADLQDLGSVGASSYTRNEFGNSTTNGELYNPEELTAAHSNIALGSIIFIENPENGSGVYVRINDRITGSGLKLSSKAFRILGLQNSGNPKVSIYSGS